MVGMVALLAVGAVGFLVARELITDDDAGSDSGEIGAALVDEPTEPTDPEAPSADAPADDSTTDGTTSETTGTDDAPGTATPPPVPVDAPYVRATLTGKDLVLSGNVPSAALVENIGQAAQLVYAPFIQSELAVDEQLPQAEWLAAAPPAIMLLQTITEGTLTLVDGRVVVQGTAASVDDAALLEARLLEATGLPVEMADIQVTNLREAIYVIAGSPGQVALSGALPSDEIRMGLAAAAAAIYGPENVLDASTVDEGVAPTLWMYNPEALMATLSQFPDFEVRLDGGAFSASLSGGSTFPTDSTEISEAFAQVLNFGVVVLSRDPSMTIAIEGHTDSDGPDDYNLQLSQARADAVAAYFVAAGITPERVTAVGVGEAEPASSNDTAEGRSRNRRVEFVLTSDE